MNGLSLELEGRLATLRWELIRIREGTLRTWADYGYGQIETTKRTAEVLEEQLKTLGLLRGNSSTTKAASSQE